MTIDIIKQEIIAKNTNQRKLSIATGIPYTTINGWFTQQKKPNTDQLAKIADYFEVTVDYLIGRTNDYGIVQANANLTQGESELLKYFRMLKSFDQGQLIGVARTLAKGV